MSGKTRRDKVRNERIRKMIEVAPIEEKIRESRLRRPTNAPIRKSDTIYIEGNARGQEAKINLGRDNKERLGMVRFDRYYGA